MPLLIIFLALLYALPYLGLTVFGACGLGSLSSQQRRHVLSLCALCLMLGLAYALLIHLNPWAEGGVFQHKDDASYDRWGWLIAQEWRKGGFPDLSSEFMIGSLHTGYYRLVAGLYVVLGHKPLAGIAINLLAMAFLPLATYFLTLQLFDEKSALRAAIISALYPAFWFHSAFLLRDVWITLFFVAATIAALRIVSKPLRNCLPDFALLILFIFQLFLLRYYLAVLIVAAWGLYELALGRRRRIAAGAFLSAIILILTARLLPEVAHLQDRMFQSFTWSIPRHLDHVQAVMGRVAIGGAKLFLAPLPWATAGGYHIDYFLWSGQWMMYLLLPLGLLGVIRTLRHGTGQAFILVMPIVFAALGFAIAYGGSVPRQRMFIDLALIVFAASALSVHHSRRERLFLGVCYCGIACFIAAHVLSLFARGIW